jgi:putative transposase
MLFQSPVHDEAVDEDRVPERGLLTVPDEVWALEVRRAEACRFGRAISGDRSVR